MASSSATAGSSKQAAAGILGPYTVLYDPESASLVLNATVGASIFGGAYGGVTGFNNGINPFISAQLYAKRYLFLTSSLFGVREYLVSPLLTAWLAGQSSEYTRRLSQLSDKQRGKLPEPTPIDELRTERLLDSALSGGIVGGVYTAFARQASVPKAAFTGALLAGSVQFLWNSARHLRLSILMRSAPKEEPTGQTLRQHIKESFADPTRKTTASDNTLSAKVMHYMSYIAPVEKITQEEYLEKLNDQRRSVEKRLAEIEREEEELFAYCQQMARERSAEK